MVWKYPQILVLLPQFLLQPIFCIGFGSDPTLRSKIRQNGYSLLAIARARAVWTDFLTSGGVGINCQYVSGVSVI